MHFGSLSSPTSQQAVSGWYELCVLVLSQSFHHEPNLHLHAIHLFGRAQPAVPLAPPGTTTTLFSHLAAQNGLSKDRNHKRTVQPHALTLVRMTSRCKIRSLVQEHYRTWLEAASGPGRRLVVLEIGAGTAVPTVRKECQRVVMDGHAEGTHVSLIRINPDGSSAPPLPGNHMCITLPACAALCGIAREMGLDLPDVPP